METTNKCTSCMDFSVCWEDWRKGLKESVKNSHTYYQDETVQILMNKLDDFLNNKVCVSSIEEELIRSMWDMADEKQRETLATLLLKNADRI